MPDRWKEGSGFTVRLVVATVLGFCAVLAVAIVIGALFAAVFFLGGRAFGHDWYPGECCSGQDCRPVVCADIAETATGFRYDGVDFSKEVERPSRDSRCHVCISESDRRGLCIFTLQGS